MVRNYWEELKSQTVTGDRLHARRATESAISTRSKGRDHPTTLQVVCWVVESEWNRHCRESFHVGEEDGLLRDLGRVEAWAVDSPPTLLRRVRGTRVSNPHSIISRRRLRFSPPPLPLHPERFESNRERAPSSSAYELELEFGPLPPPATSPADSSSAGTANRRQHESSRGEAGGACSR